MKLILLLSVGAIIATDSFAQSLPGKSLLTPYDLLYGPKPFSAGKGSEKHEPITLAGGASGDILATVNGSGVVDMITAANSAWAFLELDVYVDGEVSPSIAVNFAAACGDLFSTQVFSHRLAAVNAVGCSLFLPIPFQTSIRVAMKNTSGVSMSPYTQVSYTTGIQNFWPYQKHLHIVTTDTSNLNPNAVATLLNISGQNPGQLVWIAWQLDTTNGGSGGTSSATAPLEGNFKITIDGSNVWETTGSEDLFGAFNYFQGITAPLVSEQIAIYGLNIGGGSWLANRYFSRDPIYFNNALKIELPCGNTAQVSFTGHCRIVSSVAYYTN